MRASLFSLSLAGEGAERAFASEAGGRVTRAPPLICALPAYTRNSPPSPARGEGIRRGLLTACASPSVAGAERRRIWLSHAQDLPGSILPMRRATTPRRGAPRSTGSTCWPPCSTRHSSCRAPTSASAWNRCSAWCLESATPSRPCCRAICSMKRAGSAYRGFCSRACSAMSCSKARSASCRWPAMRSTCSFAPTAAMSRYYAGISPGSDIDWTAAVRSRAPSEPRRITAEQKSAGLFPIGVAELFLGTRADDALDLGRRAAGFFRDLAVLLDQEAVRRLVAVDAAGERARHLAVRALRAVFVEHVEHDEFGIQSRLSRHCCSPSCWMRGPCLIENAGAVRRRRRI